MTTLTPRPEAVKPRAVLSGQIDRRSARQFIADPPRGDSPGLPVGGTPEMSEADGAVLVTPAAGPQTAWRSQARTPGDIRRPYLEAMDRWEEASRRHHVASVGVASGSVSTEQLAEAKLAELEALGTVEAAKNDMAEVLFAQLRVVLADPHHRHALTLRLLNALEPALKPVADRLADMEQRLANLEALATRRGVGR